MIHPLLTSDSPVFSFGRIPFFALVHLSVTLLSLTLLSCIALDSLDLQQDGPIQAIVTLSDLQLLIQLRRFCHLYGKHAQMTSVTFTQDDQVFAVACYDIIIHFYIPTNAPSSQDARRITDDTQCTRARLSLLAYKSRRLRPVVL
ncbi:hypothetical protein FRB94_013391 [Tulasnella sp. JGI-2019a]|nr:hypothetical protein FRB94_013391 [Tulasnella sp. JGI-2019a]